MCAEYSADDFFHIFGVKSKSVKDCEGVCTDSRMVTAGNVFVALVGEVYDGHDFIENALDKGASVVIAQRSRVTEFPSYWPVLLVDDTLTALGDLALHHRLRFNIPIVAIGGAAGKTSTKDLASCVLGRKYNVLKTEKNFNNRIGVPQTLLRLNYRHDAAVIEIGTNQPGEIAELCRITRPTHGLITNIGKEHLEKLADLDGVEKEETALFSALEDSGGLSLVNLDDERLAKYSKSLHNIFTYSTSSKADVYVESKFNSALQPNLTLHISGNICKANMQTVGESAILNAVAASAIAAALGMDASEIAEALEEFNPPQAISYGRMAIERFRDFTLINDCYNANPESVLSALRSLNQYPAKGLKIAMLGDMLELGEHSSGEHVEILESASVLAEIVIAVGNEMQSSASAVNKKNVISKDKKEAAKFIESLLIDDAVLLVKGSRGMKMEEVIAQLRQ